MSSGEVPNGGAFTYRLTNIEETLRRLVSYEPAVQKQRLDEHDKDFEVVNKRIDNLIEEIASLRRALYTLALAIAGAGAAALFTALQFAG